MGIDSVAIKNFNTTGSQSVCRANEADDLNLIESEFITKCTTEYINGSGMSFTPGSISFTSIKKAGASETFTLPSDVDAISEITLQMSVSQLENVSPTFILDVIKKIEVKLGNLVVQTILPGDIYARNSTEFGNVININTYKTTPNLYTGLSANDFSLSIPFTGRSTGVNKSFLQAGAITNNLTVKIYYNTLSTSSVEQLFSYPVGATSGTLTTGLCVFSHSMTFTEKNFIAKNIINRPVNTSMSVVKAIPSGALGPFIVDLSSININVSHILLTLNNSLFDSSGVSVASLPSALTGHTGTTWKPSNSDGSGTFSGLGVSAGWLQSADLILGNDRTGNIPGSCLTTNKLDLFKLSSVTSKNIYIIKLAGSAFSTAGIPFSRLNNKKLILNFATGFSINSYVSSASDIFGLTNINVTCCGTQIQSTVGGTISFSS